MNEETWNAVDSYVEAVLVPQDAALLEATRRSAAAGLPSIAVTPAMGRLLHLLARMQGATRILEIGTLGGYSSIWLARALPKGGRLVTLEADATHAGIAQANLRESGLEDYVDLRIGQALETLPVLEREAAGPFDLVFIDADKPSSPEYFEWALKLSRPGTAIVVDNVVRGGRLAQPGTGDAGVDAMRDMTELIGREPRVTATIVQTVGAKGYDGFLLALVS
ncbi:MAG: O-methyltransferase [Acidobacteria bacterium]|nr:O-methyltransferase [Acidobacteriota bacterium]